jgi:heterotetrameric sarcosine oxidase gamma subunit
VKLQSHFVFGNGFGVPALSSRVSASSTGASDTKVVERGDIGSVLVNSAIDAEAVAAKLGVAAGIEFPSTAGAIQGEYPLRALWLTPRSWLVLCSPDEEWTLLARINAAFSDKRVHGTLFTDSLCWLELYGSHALPLLLQGGFVSLEREGLPVGHAKRTLLAGVAAIVLRERPECWLVGVERSRALYFAAWLQAADAASRTLEPHALSK